jgi:hypothetical protein
MGGEFWDWLSDRHFLKDVERRRWIDSKKNVAGIYISDVAEMSVVHINIRGSELKISEFSSPPAGKVS